jgi:hypothetical protein
MLREIGIEARQIAREIHRSTKGLQLPVSSAGAG